VRSASTRAGCCTSRRGPSSTDEPLEPEEPDEGEVDDGADDGSEVVEVVEVVEDDAAGSEELPATGGPLAALAGLGMALLLAGTTTLAARRRHPDRLTR
jgi:LPXTG-motif cell wall-anchored protein